MFLLPGNLLTFDATDEGNVSDIQCPADRVLLLKPGCKVMLLWNTSNSLVNRSQGTVINVRGDCVVVDFGAEGQVVREIWTNTSRTGDVVGSPTQIPLALMSGFTCHKSQGLTLPSVMLHCSKEYVPGLMYVSLNRVKSWHFFQVVDFNCNSLLPPLPECLNVCAQDTDPLEGDVVCSREKVLDLDDLRVGGGFELPNDHDKGFDVLEVTTQTENLMKSYFKRGEPDEMVIDLQTVFMVQRSNEASNDFCRLFFF